ncbi:MAG TPA: asparagine synthase-related protein [Noviherbaspirillum sp.]|jgi:asparagine synthase (glutamine-hydrolysing)|uniref:asparagine synthase-related protein n=1 Tax=Noviherbaspirillum sp. TaxID=1926288 RepID=UPI002DDDB2AA|nr:asparagine synthase-related protein [Noviherbaspirillum sp.]HEV2610482.1 asparagine synthase-related protein [Noviherbaspirillum sp.]
MKKIIVELSDQKWRSLPESELHMRGAAFAGDTLHRSPDSLYPQLPQSLLDVAAWSEALSRLNGFFAIVRQGGQGAVAVVDRIRSIPLFYGQRGDSIFIGDDAEWARLQVGDREMDPVARDEFQLTGFVTGNQTLYPNVKQLQAGELLIVDGTKTVPALRTHSYFRLVHQEPDLYTETVLAQQLERHADAAIQRLVQYADGRQIAIPLSGGYDSRLIASLLAKYGYENVIAFTYGIKGNKEANYSRKVARALNIPWRFVEYSERCWRDAWNTQERHDYQKWASGWSSLPHVQDWVAVRTLKKNGTIGNDAVFVPGHTCVRRHTGVPEEARDSWKASTSGLIEYIRSQHYTRSAGKTGPDAGRDIWKTRIAGTGEMGTIASAVEFASMCEKWEWRERQVKFICNSVRVYEFFGYDWWLPLWDADFIRFWQGVPLELRMGRHWYNEYVKHLYASQTGIDVHESLDNAEDAVGLERLMRMFIAQFFPGAKDHLRKLRQTVLPKAVPNGYVVSHFPTVEKRRLQRDGYHMNGMLVHEFLQRHG